MEQTSHIHCSDVDLEFDEFYENGLRFCHARVTEVCSLLTTSNRFNHPETYRYESCDKYLLKGSASRSLNTLSVPGYLTPGRLQTISRDLADDKK